MATTTGGSTYVTSTDLVANYPTASLALANRVDVVASGGPNNTKTGNYTITLADILEGDKFLYNSASPGTFTLPTSGLVDGMVVNVAQIGAGAVTVAGGTIVGTTATTAQYQGLRFVYGSSATTWYSVAPSVTAPGLAIVSPTSIANSGGSASASQGAVTFTGVTSVSLNGVFTSAYSAYRIVLDATHSTETNMLLRLRASGTDASSAYYSKLIYSRYDGTGVFGDAVRNNSDNMWIGTGGTGRGIVIDLQNPQLASATAFQMLNADNNASAPGGGRHTTATAYDGFTLYVAAGTTTGTVRVYGYKNS